MSEKKHSKNGKIKENYLNKMIEDTITEKQWENKKNKEISQRYQDYSSNQVSYADVTKNNSSKISQFERKQLQLALKDSELQAKERDQVGVMTRSTSHEMYQIDEEQFKFALKDSEMQAKEREQEEILAKSGLGEIDKRYNEQASDYEDDEFVKALTISQKEAEDRQRALKEKEEKEEKEKREKKLRERIREKEKLKDRLTEIFSFRLSVNSDFGEIENLFNEFEVKMGTTLSEGVVNRSSDGDNAKSSLILEVIQILKYSSVDIEKILKFFSFHCIHIQTLCLSSKRNVSAEALQLDDTSLFRHKAIKDKFVTIDIRGDGNCLWNSVSVALFGDYSMMESLRLLTAFTLIEHRIQFNEYLCDQKLKYGYSHELSFDGLVTAATELQVWGDELHIMALSLALNRPIYSYGSLMSFNSELKYEELKKEYEKCDSVTNHFKYIADENFETQTPILLYYDGESHYSVVIPIDKTLEPPVPKSQLLEPIIKRKNIRDKQKKSDKCYPKESQIDKRFGSEEKVNSIKQSSNQSENNENKEKEIKTNVTLISNDELSKLRFDLKSAQLLAEKYENNFKIVNNENQELKIKINIMEEKLERFEKKTIYNNHGKLYGSPSPPGWSTSLMNTIEKASSSISNRLTKTEQDKKQDEQAQMEID